MSVNKSMRINYANNKLKTRYYLVFYDIITDYPENSKLTGTILIRIKNYNPSLTRGSVENVININNQSLKIKNTIIRNYIELSFTEYKRWGL